MRTLAAPILLIAYVVLAFIGVPEIGPVLSAWFLLALSVLFVWFYVVLARGRTTVSLAAVFVVTLLFPLAVLGFIAWPSYRSWTALLSVFLTTSYEHGQFWGLEMAFPFVAAFVTATFINHRRSNMALSSDARPRPHAG